MATRLITVLVTCALGGCGSASDPVSAPKPALTFSAIAPDTYATAIEPAAARPEIEKAFRAKCGAKPWCKVIGFGDADAVAKALPLTDREAAAVKVIYTLNRSSGMDEFVWS
jgi:hypothetical protein